MNKIEILDKEILHDLYVVKGYSLKEICEHTGIKSPITIRKHMEKHNIPRRKPNHNSLENRNNITTEDFKKELYNLYIVEKKSINEISRIYNVSSNVIRKRLMKFGIPLRNHIESNKISNSGPNSKNWKGGKRKHGIYTQIKIPDHPNADGCGYVYEHRHVMEQHLNRFLSTEEHVHHINGIGNDNRLENLQVLTNQEHAALHQKQKYENQFIFRDTDFNGWKVKEKPNTLYVLAKFKELEHAKDFVKKYILNEG